MNKAWLLLTGSGRSFTTKIVQTDKRERDNVSVKGIKMVKKNFNELGISSFVSVPIIDRNRTIQKILHVYPPNSPLEAFFMEKANRKFIKGLEKALEDTQMWGLELWDLKDEDTDDANHKFNELVGEDDFEDDDKEEEVKVTKPENQSLP